MAGVRREHDEGLYDYPGGEDEYKERLGNLAATRKRLLELPHRQAEWVQELTGETFADAWRRLTKSEDRRHLLLDSGIKVYVRRGRIETFVPEDLKERLAKVA